jgi:decaprenyl-phosphate phosphoribosyltransferase
VLWSALAMASAPESPASEKRARLASSEPESSPFSAVPLSPQAEASLFHRVGGYVRTLRPHQWVKNVFVLAPVFFAKDLFDPRLFFRAAGAFGVFCVLAGAVYTINDIADVEADRRHPVKRFRPIASGRISASSARVLALVLVVVGLAGAAYGPLPFLLVALAYFVQNLAYSFKLKHYAYLDVAIIATGFVLRVVGGGFGTHVHVSSYLIMCTALLALFLGFGKRRHELAVSAARASSQRAAMSGYTATGLDVALGVTGIATVGTYLAYTLDSDTRRYFGSNKLFLTTAFVLWTFLRFLHLVRSRPHAESPTQEMLRDGPFVAAVLLWVGVVVWIVYNLRPG